MKNTFTKYPAIIAMIISLFSFGLMIASLVALFIDTPTEHAHGGAFGFWVFGVIVALFSLIFYFIDAVLSIIKACMKIHPIFNSVLAVMLIAAIPMAIFVGGGLGINIYIWNAYHLAIFILEIVSIVKHVKLNSHQNDRNDDSDQEPSKTETKKSKGNTKKIIYYAAPFVFFFLVFLLVFLLDSTDIIGSGPVFILMCILLLSFPIIIGGFSPSDKKFDYIITAIVPLALLFTLFIFLFFDEGCDGKPQLSISHALNIEYYKTYFPIAAILTVSTFVASFKPIRFIKKERK